MNIFERLKDLPSKKTFEEQNSEAIKMFDQQKNAIKNIKDTEGYAEIKRFFERERKISLDRVMSALQPDNQARAMYIISDRFLEFLTTRER